MIADDIKLIINDARANQKRTHCVRNSTGLSIVLLFRLLTKTNDTLVKMSLPDNNNSIIASRYQLYLPTEQQLINEVEKVKSELNSRGVNCV